LSPQLNWLLWKFGGCDSLYVNPSSAASAGILLLRSSDEELKKVVFNITPPSAPAHEGGNDSTIWQSGPQRIGNKNDAGEQHRSRVSAGRVLLVLVCMGGPPKSAQL